LAHTIYRDLPSKQALPWRCWRKTINTGNAARKSRIRTCMEHKTVITFVSSELSKKDPRTTFDVRPSTQRRQEPQLCQPSQPHETSTSRQPACLACPCPCLCTYPTPNPWSGRRPRSLKYRTRFPVSMGAKACATCSQLPLKIGLELDQDEKKHERWKEAKAPTTPSLDPKTP